MKINEHGDVRMKVAVACEDANGYPTLHVVDIICGVEQMNDGDHLSIAGDKAIEDGYKVYAGFIAFDELIHSNLIRHLEEKW